MQLLFLNAWQAKLQKPFSDFILRQKQFTDVFCLQESNSDVRNLMRHLLGEFKELSADKYLSSNNTFNQSMYVAPHVSVESSGILLKPAADAGLGLHAALKSGPLTLQVCNVHGISIRNIGGNIDDKLDKPARMRQSAALIDYFRGSLHPVVIGGDLNMRPDTKSIQMFSEAGYRDLIHDFKVPTTRNHYVWDRYPKTPQYFSDYVFTSPGISTVSFQVLPDMVSDHQPISLKVAAAQPVAMQNLADA